MEDKYYYFTPQHATLADYYCNHRWSVVDGLEYETIRGSDVWVHYDNSSAEAETMKTEQCKFILRKHKLERYYE